MEYQISQALYSLTSLLMVALVFFMMFVLQQTYICRDKSIDLFTFMLSYKYFLFNEEIIVQEKRTYIRRLYYIQIGLGILCVSIIVLQMVH